ncbi:MAG TPA: NADH dehydrogenase (quinone) subunit D [Ignavibacteria bacterium]|nr:NADH dehydrogenase (quinone) subunit D [Ignavibacteria bacterium]HRF66887.1 NADH dehydrogenase (quinone) subunit D [Ignavibacteria bacterium]HRJ04610.1 NADH dehydrogenase (quinone) subunit D [Ignavibacteria bacterium]HRJ86285.1 NADH dehydrogenase (quinone) subunit D [Ignavibacteria bacterium]
MSLDLTKEEYIEETKEESHISMSQEKILRALESDDVRGHFEGTLDNQLVLNMGPQHPATHGVLQLVVSLDGESVVGTVPVLGYLHRGYEKLAENMTFHEFIPHTDRLDYLSPLANNVGYVLAIEKLLKIEATERAQWIRTMCCEMARLASHCVWMGTMAMDVGALTVFLWTFTEREKILDILDILTGVRFTTSYTRIGGLALDMSDEVIARLKAFLDQFIPKLEDARALIERNKIFINRCEGVGYISKEDAISLGLTGPNLRAVGIANDLRIDDPYLKYREVDFNVPTLTESDVLARYYVRVQEMYESVKILRQCIQKLPQGPINTPDAKQVLPDKGEVYSKMEELIHDFMIVNFGNTPEKGVEAYQAIESSKGELGFYAISDGKGYPFRLKIRSPSTIAIGALPTMMKGAMISDIVAIIGSIDPVMGEADK